MFASARSQQVIGRSAWVLAWVGLVGGDLHALARHATADGKNDLQNPLTRLWSDPTRKALRPLLDWGSPDAVYLTYGKIWLPVFAAFTLCAFIVHRRRAPVGFEKWAWRVALTGYVLATLGIFLEYYTQLTTYNAFFNVAFLLVIPAFFITVVGSTMLGIALLRNRFEPRATSWLLALTIPMDLVILQFTSLGNAALPIMFAFAIVGRRIGHERPAAGALRTSPGRLGPAH
jgi:hypothetical protein